MPQKQIDMRSIKTAPMDGTKIIGCYSKGRYQVISWCAKTEEWRDCDNSQVWEPSYWLPFFEDTKINMPTELNR